VKNTIVPALRSSDPEALLRFLVAAFGFTERALHRNDEGLVDHAELTFEGGMVMIGRAGRGTDFDAVMDPAAPVRTTLYVIVGDVDAHHARAVAAGADVVYPLTDQDYGSRDYSCKDPDGNLWSFGTYDPWAH